MALTKVGSGVLTLGGADDYSGNTTVSAGVLQVANASSIPSGPGYGNVEVDGTLDLNACDISINGLTGSGTIATDSPGPATLTAGGNDQTSQFDGAIDDGSGIVAVKKTGAGTLTLADADDYSGDTTIAAGSSRSPMPPPSPAAPATATWRSTNPRPERLHYYVRRPDGSRDDHDDASAPPRSPWRNDQTSQFDGLIEDGSGVVTLTKIGSGTLTVTGASTFSGGTTINPARLGWATGRRPRSARAR